jgi:hypothetical protein
MSGPSLRTCPECGGRPEARGRCVDGCPENRAHDETDAPASSAAMVREADARLAAMRRAGV